MSEASKWEPPLDLRPFRGGKWEEVNTCDFYYYAEATDGRFLEVSSYLHADGDQLGLRLTAYVYRDRGHYEEDDGHETAEVHETHVVDLLSDLTDPDEEL